MEQTPSPYRWIGYMSIWMLACLGLSGKSIASETFPTILLLLSIVINSYFAYKFALEKGTFLAILSFVVAMILDFLLLLIYFVLNEIEVSFRIK